MPSDEHEVLAYLADAGWTGATVRPLTGDASNRSYRRVHLEDRTAVLMIAPRDRGEDTEPFVRVARFLKDRGLSAPEIFFDDPGSGFLLIEDLGDDLYARLCARDQSLEEPLYKAAVHCLVALHEHAPPPDVPAYDVAGMSALSGLAWEWYAGTPMPDDVERALTAALQAIDGLDEVLALRDFHAENLIWLPGRDGVARVGLLDFQDAMKGHRAYDLVSLLEDARRDVANDLRDKMIDLYVDQTGVNDADFRFAFSALGAQRNLRILGVFARLWLRDGKPGYLDLIPRVWDHLIRDLSHPGLRDLRACVLPSLPEPAEALANRLRRP